ncbi:N-acetylmuramoyl-L-alanine amidase [Candidatus Dependentiae bacterium]|nr:N-acetylmuramoyl-L-alanine amidase [Candidatus Dependentiae bacterium]
MSLNRILLYIFLCNINLIAYSITIMIDPLGDAKYTGCEIEDTFERSLTLQCAQRLKQIIEETFSNTKVVITRNAGDTIQQLQNASYANRINPDLYICLSFYHQKSIPGHIAIFYYLENSIDTQHAYNPLHFYHVSQAYLKNVASSKQFALKAAAVLKQKSINPHFLCIGTFGIPCMPLFGIQPPALFIQAGLAHKNNWKYLIDPIIEVINTSLMRN